MSLPARGVWIEMSGSSAVIVAYKLSLPARGVWIEIFPKTEGKEPLCVTPREGSVD